MSCPVFGHALILAEMNLREAILEEHSKRQCMRIVKWIGNDKKRFAELIRLFTGNEYRVVQRAAWPLSYCVIDHPALVRPHLGKLIRNLAKPGLHPAVARNTLRFLQDIEVPEKYLGELTENCFRLFQNRESPIAVKVFSMTVLTNIAKKEPDLAREIRLLIEPLLEEGSPGEKSRGKRMIKKLEKIEQAVSA